METPNQTERTPVDKMFDRAAIFLRNISGFSSCMTVCVISMIFVWSVHIGVSEYHRGYPGLFAMTIMIIGPIIMAWNFNNAKSIISTILVSVDGDEADVEQTKVAIPKAAPIITEEDIAIERGVVGRLGIALRYFAGCVSTHVICACSLLFTWTIHLAYANGGMLPSNSELFMVVVGPIVTSWNFVRATATLNTVIKGASQFDKWRSKLSSWIAPNR